MDPWVDYFQEKPEVTAQEDGVRVETGINLEWGLGIDGYAALLATLKEYNCMGQNQGEHIVTITNLRTEESMDIRKVLGVFTLELGKGTPVAIEAKGEKPEELALKMAGILTSRYHFDTNSYRFL